MACQKKPAPGSILVLGPMPLKAAPQTHIAAGPWCFAEREDFFPDWEENYLFAPDPLLDRNEEDRLIREAETLAADVIPRPASSSRTLRFLTPTGKRFSLPLP